MSRRVTALNNTGINNLHRGFFAESIRSFRMAMECVNVAAQNDHDMFEYGEPECFALPLFPVGLQSLHDANALQISPHNTFDVYQTAFAFPKMNNSRLFRSEISLVLFYNMALTHHLAVLSGMKQSQCHLEQAVKFYKLALTVFKSSPDMRLDETCYAVVLGALVNLGHLFVHVGCYEDAISCRRRLEDFLECPNVVIGLSEDDGDFFFSVLSFSAEFVAAPAA